MPPIDQDQIVRAVLAELDRRRLQERFMPADDLNADEDTSGQDAVSPTKLATLGAAADAASTYVGMKRGGKETNPLVAERSPAVTAAGAAAGGGIAALITAIVAKKWPKVANAIRANQGAEQLAAAVGNVAGSPDSAEDYTSAMQRSAAEQAKRQRTR
jgi:hypothetical protein